MKEAVGIVNKESETAFFNLYPNPVNHSTTLSFVIIYDNISVSIYNTLGQKIQDYFVNSSLNNELKIDFDALQVRHGVYFVNVTAGSETNTYKLLYNPD